jgi:hypothetical protein
MKHRISDAELLGVLTKPGSKDIILYYRFKCIVHGYVEN